MTENNIPAHLLGEQDAEAVPDDNTIATVRDAVQKYTQLDARKTQLEADLKEVSREVEELKHKTLPAIFAEAGIDKFGIPGAEFDAVQRPYFKANIAADWEPEKREAAFAWLDGAGHGDVINTKITITVPREAREDAIELEQKIRQLTNYPVEAVLGVPWNTLTALVKTEVEAGNVVPLETLGATVGTIVELKKRRK